MAISSIIMLPFPFPKFPHKLHRTIPSIPPTLLSHFKPSPLTIPSKPPTLLSHFKPSPLTIPSKPPTLPTQTKQPIIPKPLLCTTIFISATLASYFLCGAAGAADDSIRASGIGVKVANALRRSGWADEAVVFALATLPIIELRGAIPVGYWMHLDPVMLTVLSILGNMVPVPLIILYLKRLAGFLSQKSVSATRLLDMLFERAREKAGPVEEFKWLGLMLFVAVPFPGTGAWTGAIVASVLDMPFWSAVSANFFGVVLAGLLVNMLVNLGLKYAVGMGVILFLVSTLMWSVLRKLKKPSSSN